MAYNYLTDMGDRQEWGKSPLALLPKALRGLWFGRELPEFALRGSGLPVGTTLDQLDARVWDAMAALPSVFEHYLLRWVTHELPTIGDVPVLDPPVRDALLLTPRIPWRPRLANALERAGLFADPQQLASMTFGDLSALRTVGVRLMLEFGVTAERYLDASRSAEAPRKQAVMGPPNGEAIHEDRQSPRLGRHDDPHAYRERASVPVTDTSGPDATDLRWGMPGVPLLPGSLRSLWSSVPLPRWIAERLDLPSGTTLVALDAAVWTDMPSQPQYRTSVERYVVNLLSASREQVGGISALGRPWPENLNPADVPWRARTRNALIRSGVHGDVDRLSVLTFGELLALPHMGIVSALDFAATAEAAMERAEVAESATAMKEEAMVEALRDVVGEEWADFLQEDPRFIPHTRDRDGRHSPISRTGQLPLPISAAAYSDGKDEETASTLQATVERAQEISHMPLDAALRDYMISLTGASGVRLDALLMRLGWDGMPPRTLEECAGAMGVTRERVRQIQRRVMQKKPGDPVFLPALDRALETLAGAAPIGAMAAAQLLQTQGITTVPFHPTSVLSAAEFCNHTATFVLDKGADAATVVTTSSAPYANRVVNLARRLAGASGVTNLAELEAAVMNGGLSIASEQIKEALLHYSRAAFLVDDWFWMPEAPVERNRLYNVARRILAVTYPRRVSVSALREGARRVFRMRAPDSTFPLVLPPRAVLAAYFAAHPAFVVDDAGHVGSAMPLDFKAELGPTDRVLVEILRSSPSGLMPRQELAETCGRRGINRATFSHALSYSPIIEHLGTGIWGLRGIPADPVDVAALQGDLVARRRTRRVLDYGWTPDGNLWLTVRLTGSDIHSYPLNI
ncbi:MAG: sigma factor-like helix-turn-helix DNA-binding protein, partial [Dehalococcoidia bacterium]